MCYRLLLDYMRPTLDLMCRLAEDITIGPTQQCRKASRRDNIVSQFCRTYVFNSLYIDIYIIRIFLFKVITIVRPHILVSPRALKISGPGLLVQHQRWRLPGLGHSAAVGFAHTTEHKATELRSFFPPRIYHLEEDD